ncbi:import component protein [Flavobacterium crocinum]|uniref:Import component protein n=1 Tax=Flavobacterium crocinum TaxID=2183896 RepID=A0A2S1YPY5_9FLAO|nr:import component protein [Flavobacterium crocinum]AWK06170.1 import component protein [Flavobacterium crocinum]
MNNKTLSILSYITIIGWIVAFVKSKDLTPKSDLVSYHLKQGFGIFLVSLVINIALSIVVSIVPALYFLSYVGYVILILWIFGIINAANEQKKPIPVIGKIFEDKFSFIN